MKGAPFLANIVKRYCDSPHKVYVRLDYNRTAITWNRTINVYQIIRKSKRKKPILRILRHSFLRSSIRLFMLMNNVSSKFTTNFYYMDDIFESFPVFLSLCFCIQTKLVHRLLDSYQQSLLQTYIPNVPPLGFPPLADQEPGTSCSKCLGMCSLISDCENNGFVLLSFI